ncbi:MAG: molybdopterin-dependent oxidoreductase [Pseudomonadota bacterium]
MANREIIRTTCTRDCYDSCGIAVVKEDGRVRKVLGDPNHAISRGALCGKCAIAYNGAWRDPEQRLGTPLKRSGPKGSGQFEPVSWDEALAAIAGRLQEIVAGPGPQSVVHAHYTGTCSLIAGGFPGRFFNHLGATEVAPDTICNNAGHVALGLLYGTSVDGFDPKTAKDSACIMVWGANPSASAPHAHRHWLKDSPARVVVIDPVRHETAAAADLHLQPFPGSDAALAFALLHVLERDGKFDRDFIAANTMGFDELADDIAAATPAWAEEVTGVPAADIEQAAALYGAGPALLWLGQGLQRQPLGGNVMRACGLLPAATGNIGKPGAGICYLNGKGPRQIDGDYASGGGEPGAEISHMDLVPTLADPAKSAAFFNWNMNVAASAPRQAELMAALAREDLFTVVVELFQTDTAAYADYILPAASFLEFDDLMVPYFHFSVSAQVKADEPPGEALPNQEIFRRLARAMGYNEPSLYEDDRAILDHVLAKSGLGITFDQLAEAGTIDPWDSPIIQFQNLKFPTPSGKIEVASDQAEADGHPRLPHPGADPRPAAGRLRLLSPASKWVMNDSYGNDAGIQGKLGPVNVTLHPADAADMGVAEGDPVELANDLGRLAMVARLSDEVPRGAALAHKGRWPACEPSGASVNLLNPGLKTDMGESSCVHGVEVTVSRA